MEFFTDITARAAAMRCLTGDVDAPASLPDAIDRLDDDGVVEVLQSATDLAKRAEQIRLAAAGVIARRSRRESGHSGLAQTRGHRSTISLIQQMTGSTRAEAAKQVRVGESLFPIPPSPTAPTAEASGASGDADSADPCSAGPHLSPAPVASHWHEPLRRALWDGTVTAAQHDAIARGLGEPTVEGTGQESEAWALAAEQLVIEAEHRTVEELGSAARVIRDRLDPEGAEARYLARCKARSFRMWTDREGLSRGAFVFDDESAAWVRSVIDAALRPRRGGPRFVDPADKERASRLSDDPRTNEQLTYDLMIDVFRAGTLADAESVFDTRQAGVRLVQVVETTVADGDGFTPRGPAHTVDGIATLPPRVAARQACSTGAVTITVDPGGNPLNVGREQRLYSARQRIALAIRDGGCRWRGCDRPASYCEAHHIDEWAADGGRTDIDRGILLCRYHHMQLHNGKWRITREGRGEFVLHHPPEAEATTPLPPRLALEYAWRGIDPPPRRFRLAA